MRAHRLQVQVPANHRLSLELPESFPAGPAEVIILTQASEKLSVFRAGGALRASRTAAGGDPVADALRQIRDDRSTKIDQLADELQRHRS